MKRTILTIGSTLVMTLFFTVQQTAAQCLLEIPSATKIVNATAATVNEESESTLLAKGSAEVTFKGSSNTIIFPDGSSGKVLGTNNTIYVGVRAHVDVSGQTNTIYKVKGATVTTVAKSNEVKECAKLDIKNSLDADASADISIGGVSIGSAVATNTTGAATGGANALVKVGKATGKVGKDVGAETVEVGKDVGTETAEVGKGTAEFGKESSVIAGETIIEASADVSNSLIGTWNVTKGMIGDQAYEVKGRIIFNKDGSGYNDYQIKYEGQIIVRQNKFDWKSDAIMIYTKAAGMTMEWKRLLNEQAKQSAEVKISAEVSMQLMMERRK